MVEGEGEREGWRRGEGREGWRRGKGRERDEGGGRGERGMEEGGRGERGMEEEDLVGFETCRQRLKTCISKCLN